jgi:hypothetical protein
MASGRVLWALMTCSSRSVSLASLAGNDPSNRFAKVVGWTTRYRIDLASRRVVAWPWAAPLT